MGCRPSKVDDLPLVIRCRERKRLIKSAADYRYDLSSSHLAYFHSLRDIGFALSRFVDEQLVIPSPSPSSPVLTLPSDQGKANNNGSMSSGSISHIHSIDGGHGDSDSDSDLSTSQDGHIHLHDTGGGFENEKPRSSSFHRPHGHDYNEMDSNDPYLMNRQPPPYQPTWGPNQASFSDPYAMNRGQPQPQPPYQPPWGEPYVVNPSAFPWGPNQTSWGENEPYVVNPSASQYQPPWGPPYQENFDSYNEYGGNPNSNSNSNHYASYMKKSAPATRTVIQPEEARGFQETRQWVDPPHYNPYENAYGYGFSYGGPPPPQEPKKPKSPPPPPPPPKDDYLNFFDAHDYGYPGYGYGYGSMVSSPDSSEVREREGIPDLEEETETESHYEEVVKGNNNNNTHNTKRNLGEGTSREHNGQRSRRIPPRKSEDTDTPMEPHDEATLASDNNEGPQSVEIEVDKHSPETVVEGHEGKKGVSFDVDVDEDSIVEVESSMLSSLTTLSLHGSRDLQEVVNEIKDEFEVAFGYGKEVALMLEAGKLPYQSRFAVLKVVLSKILSPSVASSEHPVQSVRGVTKLAGSYIVDDAAADVRSINLSSTLEKLYVWEKKLYKEVKDEERLRVMYEKMYKKLNELDANGAETSKIDAAQASIRRLMTKLNVSIKAIDAISTHIHYVRDKELEPQVSHLIYGLIRMWQAIVKCHRKQFEALMESRSRTLRTNTFQQQQDSNKSRAVLELESGLVTWSHHFNKWINAQKAYIDSLNGWLSHCIDHHPEPTIDGEAPYSPGRVGAPPIFVICHDWHREIQSVSQDRVSTAIHGFASNLRHLMERQDDVERILVKKKEDLAGIRRKLPEKTMVPSESGRVEEEYKEAMKLVGNGGLSSLQGGVIPIFRALETFTCDALKAHEQVRLRG